jgi:hypothetical protein
MTGEEYSNQKSDTSGELKFYMPPLLVQGMHQKQNSKKDQETKIKYYDPPKIDQTDDYIRDYQIYEGDRCDDSACVPDMIEYEEGDYVNDDPNEDTNTIVIEFPHHKTRKQRIVPIVPISICVALIVMCNLAVINIYTDLLARNAYQASTYFGIWVNF